MQPAFSSNRLGIEAKFHIIDTVAYDIRRDLLNAIGDVVPDYRFWIPTSNLYETHNCQTLVRVPDTARTHLLNASRSGVNRLALLKTLISLGFCVNDMLIPELRLSNDVIVSVACHTEPYNFHPRLLSDNNYVDACSVTFRYVDGLLNSSTELMIISVICRTCGFSRL